MKKKIIILGRTGAGKDTLANYLTNRYGLKQLLSVTTRPKRTPHENTHIFVSAEEANKMTDRVAETVIDGYEYFATKQQLDECDIYVVDPKGLQDTCERAPDTELLVVYINADVDIRRERAIARAADPFEAERIFESRNADENAQFTAFENLAYSSPNPDINLAFRVNYPSAIDLILIDNSVCDLKEFERCGDELYAMLND